MYQIIFLFCFIIPSIRTDGKFNSTEASILSCGYCQTMACRCHSLESILNCSSYLLNLTFASNCAQMIIWETVDFSSRNLESLDSTRLLSLRMHRLLLKSNLISKIDEKTFDSVGDILIELDLEMNQMANISSKWLNSNLIQLKKLNLASNQLESFIHLDDVHLPQLQELNLSRNQIDIFPSKIHQWTSLIILDLSFNKLSSIPRFALMGLNNLTWLSLASNRNLSCVIQDSFKYLKSLTYLDLSSTNLFDLDACIFIQLTGLKTLQIERVSLNCSSCWMPIAKENSIQLFGQCLYNTTIKRLDSLTNKQLEYACSKSSIDCSSDYCEAGLIIHEHKSDKIFTSARSSNLTKSRTADIILGIIFGIIALIILMTVIILISRWKQGKTVLCCPFFQTTTTTAEATRRRRQHHKQIIDCNPAVIESVVTHGANMNVPHYSQHNYAYFNDETSNNKRKLYNPMFADSPASDIKHPSQVVMVSNDSTSQDNQFYSENL